MYAARVYSFDERKFVNQILKDCENYNTTSPIDITILYMR